MNRFETLATPLALFHDGQCPLCRKEIAWLRRHPRSRLIHFIDIRDDDFCAEAWGQRFDDMLGKLHLRDATGHWFIGMDASRALYATLGHRRWVRLSSVPGVRGLLNIGYLGFARLRPWLTGHQRKR